MATKFKFKPDDCPHRILDRDIVLGMDSGDRVCRECGKSGYLDWAEKELAARPAKSKKSAKRA